MKQNNTKRKQAAHKSNIIQFPTRHRYKTFEERKGTKWFELFTEGIDNPSFTHMVDEDGKLDGYAMCDGEMNAIWEFRLVG